MRRLENSMKQRVNISLTEDTAERLRMFAWENHKTLSQAVTDWTWAAKVKNSQIRGQTSLSGLMSRQKTSSVH